MQNNYDDSTLADATLAAPGLGTPVDLDEMSIRGAMSEFATGVTIVTTQDEEKTIGFACQSFTSLSLEPPMILFTVMKSSRSWPHIEKTGTFAVNVLSEDQQNISAEFGRRGGLKFGVGQWSPSPLGNPLLHGSSVWIDCTVADVYEGGDHWIIAGNIKAIGQRKEARPLVYHRGSYVLLDEQGIDAPIEEKWRQRPSV